MIRIFASKDSKIFFFFIIKEKSGVTDWLG